MASHNSKSDLPIACIDFSSIKPYSLVFTYFSSEDEYQPRQNDGISPQSEDQQCIFVKNTNGPGFVGLTPNQLQHIQISATGTGNSPQRRKQTLPKPRSMLT